MNKPTEPTISQPPNGAQPDAGPSGFLIVALAVARSAELTPAAKLVYGCLRFAAGRSSDSCRVSVAGIRRNSALSGRWVKSALVKLYRQKRLEVERQAGRASGYRLLGEQPADGYLVIPLAVAASDALTPAAKLVYGALRRAAGRSGSQCGPAERWIGEQTGLGRRTVRRAIRKLSEHKAITIEPEPGKPSSYRLLILEAQPKPPRSERPAPAGTAAVAAAPGAPGAAPAVPARRLTRREREDAQMLAMLDNLRGGGP